MKRLLTFIYGIIYFCFAIYFQDKYAKADELYKCVIYFILMMVMIVYFIEKLEKATK